MAAAGAFELISYTNPIYNGVTGKYTWSLTIKNVSGSTANISDYHIFNHFRGVSGVSPYHNTMTTGYLIITSTKATFAPTAFSSYGYTMTFTEAISDEEEMTLNVELTVAYGSLIYEKFSFTGDYGFTVYFTHFGNVCGIADGLLAGSTSVKLVADMEAGTQLFLYKCGNAGSAPTYIGTGTIADGTPGYAMVTPSESIVGGVAYIGYAGTPGFATYGAFVALWEANLNSGWKQPASLFDATNDETTYEDYIDAGGTPIAPYYDPKNTVNRAAKAECTVVDFDLTPRFDLEIVRDGDDYIVTVINSSGYLGNIRLIWDSGEETSDRTQTFTGLSGVETHEVTIFHETDDNIFASRSFTIDNTINSYTSEIWGVSYEPNQADNKQVAIIAYGTAALQAKIVEVDDTWHTMTLVAANTNKYILGGVYYNVSAGTKTIQIKRSTEGTYEVACPLILNW